MSRLKLFFIAYFLLMLALTGTTAGKVMLALLILSPVWVPLLVFWLSAVCNGLELMQLMRGKGRLIDLAMDEQRRSAIEAQEAAAKAAQRARQARPLPFPDRRGARTGGTASRAGAEVRK